MSHSRYIDLVKTLWAAWPPLPDNELCEYRMGAIDGDPLMIEDVESLTRVDVFPITDLLFFFARDGLFYRLSGCAAWQLAHLFDHGNCPDPDIPIHYCFSLVGKESPGRLERGRSKVAQLKQEQLLGIALLLDMFCGYLRTNSEFVGLAAYNSWSAQEVREFALRGVQLLCDEATVRKE